MRFNVANNHAAQIPRIESGVSAPYGADTVSSTLFLCLACFHIRNKTTLAEFTQNEKVATVETDSCATEPGERFRQTISRQHLMCNHCTVR